MEKEKTEYPDLTLDNKKAVTNEEKVKLFEVFRINFHNKARTQNF